MKTILVFAGISMVYIVVVFLRGVWREKRSRAKKEKPISPPSGGETKK